MRDADLTRQLTQEVRNLADRMTELAALTRGNIRDNVLYSGTRILDAAGLVFLEFQVSAASVMVQASDTAGTVTFAAAPPAAAPPTEGNGVHQVPTGGMLCVPLIGNVISIYGTAGDVVDIAVWSKPQPPAGA